jgi:alpha-ketoglutarate-dependent taurine dioxygenase
MVLKDQIGASSRHTPVTQRPRRLFKPTRLSSSNQQKPVLHVAETLSDYLYAHAKQAAHIIVLRGAGTDMETLKAVVALLGEANVTRAFGEIREIVNKPELAGKSIAHGFGPHPDHTDGTFDATAPIGFLLQAAKIDPNGGGLSVFKPLLPMLDEVPSYTFILALMRGVIRYRRIDENGVADAYRGHILKRENGMLRFRWRYDDHVKPEVVDDCGLPLQEAVDWLAEKIESTEPATYAAKEGDIIWIDNMTCTHGRTAMTPGSPRMMRRVWLY